MDEDFTDGISINLQQRHLWLEKRGDRKIVMIAMSDHRTLNLLQLFNSNT